MATGEQLRAKAKALLAKNEATPRTVYFREVTQVGGNPKLGIGGTVVNTDTLVDPQPVALKVTAQEIADSNGYLGPGDWRFIFSGDTPEATLKSHFILFGDEVLNIVQITPYAKNKTIVAWDVIGRTVSKTS